MCSIWGSFIGYSISKIIRWLMLLKNCNQLFRRSDREKCVRYKYPVLPAQRVNDVLVMCFSAGKDQNLLKLLIKWKRQSLVQCRFNWEDRIGGIKRSLFRLWAETSAFTNSCFWFRTQVTFKINSVIRYRVLTSQEPKTGHGKPATSQTKTNVT